MPCRDDARIPIETAGLCAVMRALVQLGLVEQVMARVDWDRAGLTERELNEWWWMHKRADTSAKLEW